MLGLGFAGQSIRTAEAVDTYYVNPGTGNDSNPGTLASPFKTLNPVNPFLASSCSTDCAQTVNLARGFSYSGITLAGQRSGTSGSRITIQAYGTGTNPKLEDANPCIDLTGSYYLITGIEVKHCGTATNGSGCSPIPCPVQPVGIRVAASNNKLDGVTVRDNMVGVKITGAATGTELYNSTIINNTQGYNDIGSGTHNGSSGNGINLHSASNQIKNNTIQGNYWTDQNGCRHGSGIEIFGDDGEYANSNTIARNLAIDNEAFSEIGVKIDDKGTADESDDVNLGHADGNLYYFNVVRGSIAAVDCSGNGSGTTCSNGLNGQTGVITRGDKETGSTEYGPVFNTYLYHNTFDFTGTCSQALSCGGVCASNILTAKDNVFQAGWKGGFIGNADDSLSALPTTVDYNLFRKTLSSPSSGNHCQWQTGGVGANCPAQAHGLTHGTDPLFENEGSWDLRPDCSPVVSPLINAGMSAGLSPDYNGDTVPQESVNEIGAFERDCP